MSSQCVTNGTGNADKRALHRKPTDTNRISKNTDEVGLLVYLSLYFTRLAGVRRFAVLVVGVLRDESAVGRAPVTSA